MISLFAINATAINIVEKANILSAFCLIITNFQHGEVDCWPQDCPPTPCTSPAHLPGSCCPSCPNTPLPYTLGNSSCGVQAGLLRSEGDSWHLPGTICNSCGCKVTLHTPSKVVGFSMIERKSLVCEIEKFVYNQRYRAPIRDHKFFLVNPLMY